MTRFVEIHALQWFPFSCINRDDAGLPKSMSLGGERRARWSSQSQKYAARMAFKGELDANTLCTKTRRLPILALHELTRRGRGEAEAAERVVATMAILGVSLATSEDARKEAEADAPDAADVEIEAPVVFGKVLTGRTQVILPVPAAGAALLADAVEAHWDELGGIVDLAKVKSGKAKDIKVPSAVAKAVQPDAAKAIDASRLVDVALFGRMLTEIPGQTVEAACSVSHAFTTHPDDFTGEFWAAVDDDAASQGHGGSANMGTQGFTSGCFYRYAVVDIDTLRAKGSPLAGEDELIREAVAAFVRTFATLHPRAMIHGTAPFVDPALVVVTVTERPRMMGDAFVRPVEDGDYLASSANRLAETWKANSDAFGARGVQGFVLSGHPDTADVDFLNAQKVASLDKLIDSALEVAFRG